MNKIIIFGRIANDPELKYGNSGKAYCRIRVASDTGWGDRKKTLWLDGMLFDKRAEAIQPHLSKGDKVSIVGQLQEPSTWQSGEETRVSLTVFVDEIQFSGKQEGGNRGQPPASPPSRPPPAAPDYDEDIPF